MSKAADEKFWSWFHLECVFPFALVLLVIPLGVAAGPYTIDNAAAYAVHTLASGELPAVAFCLLMPLVLLANKADPDGRLGLYVVIGTLIAGGVYWMMKFQPAIPFNGTKAIAGRPIAYSLISLGFTYFAASTAISVRKALHDYH